MLSAFRPSHNSILPPDMEFLQPRSEASLLFPDKELHLHIFPAPSGSLPDEADRQKNNSDRQAVQLPEQQESSV